MFGSVLLSSLHVWAVMPMASDIELMIGGGIVGALVGWLGGEKWLLAIDAAIFAFWSAIAFTGIMNPLAEHWVRRDAAPASARAVVVLSSAETSESILDPFATDRLLTGLNLVQHGVAPKLVTTRIFERRRQGTIISDADQRFFVQLAHVEPEWMIVDSVANTHDEAVGTARLLSPTRNREIVVVTSPMHTRRACGTFEAVGFTVACIPSRESEHSTWHPISPNDRLASFGDYLYERLGMVKYRAKGWVR